MKCNIWSLACEFSVLTSLLVIGTCFSCTSSTAQDGYIKDQYGALNVKEVYLQEIQKMSLSDAKKRLIVDSQALAICMDSLRDLRFNVSARISLDSYYKREKDTTKVVNHFRLLPKDFVDQELNSVNDIKFTQVYRYPSSGFRFNFSSLKELLSAKNVSITPVELYGNKARFSLESVSLHTIDSMRTDLKFSYPTSYDSIVIDRRKEPEIKYENGKIGFRYIDDSELRLHVPTGINIIGDRGVNKDGSVLSAKSSGVMPVLVIRPEVEGIVQKVKQQFDRAIQAKSQEEVFGILNELSEEEFLYATKLTRGARILDEFYSLEEHYYQTIISMLSKLQEDYHLIFHEEYVKYYFEYDRAIDKVVLYVGKDYEVVSKTIMAKNSKAVVPYYIIYQDDEYSNYGISSREGEIIIPAQYSDLGYVSEAFAEGEKVYYFERENDRGEMLYYYLDIEKRELSPLKEGIYYLGSFGKIAVFENKDEQRGVLLGNKVIVPLRYDRIDISKELYIGMVTKLGRPTYDFYDTAGKLISVDSFNEIDDISVNSAQIIVKDNAKRRGMLNGKGKLIAPFKYSTLMRLGEDIYVYVEEGDESENNAGLMDGEGKYIIPPTYSFMEKMYDGLIAVRDRNGSVMKYGYIDKKGKVIIAPVYDEGKNFVRGYALVQLGADYALIDRQGKVIKEFTKGNIVRTVFASYSGFPAEDKEEFYREYDGGSKTIYFYNYKGNLVSVKKS